MECFENFIFHKHKAPKLDLVYRNQHVCMLPAHGTTSEQKTSGVGSVKVMFNALSGTKEPNLADLHNTRHSTSTSVLLLNRSFVNFSSLFMIESLLWKERMRNVWSPHVQKTVHSNFRFYYPMYFPSFCEH